MARKPKAAAKGKGADDATQETKPINLLDYEVRDDEQPPADQAPPADVELPAGLLLDPEPAPAEKPIGLRVCANVLASEWYDRMLDIDIFEKHGLWPPELVKRERRKAQVKIEAARFIDLLIQNDLLPAIRQMLKQARQPGPKRQS